MNQRFDTILKSGTVVNQDGEGIRDIGISNGRIAAIGGLRQASAGETIDCKGLHILPGVMDTQVHIREPGLTHKEDLETGSRSAVMGGVTAVFEMPNTNPLTTSADALADKLARARGRMWCDHAFFVGGTAENAHELAELRNRSVDLIVEVADVPNPFAPDLRFPFPFRLDPAHSLELRCVLAAVQTSHFPIAAHLLRVRFHDEVGTPAVH
jgi:dihydroorotase-like cyclic amidohydrolase